jgi:hypothetical protein
MPPQIEIGAGVTFRFRRQPDLSGLSKEYIGRLARRDVLVGQIIAGMWFLDRGHLRPLIAERAKKRSTKP